jgi:hypothetical protein
MAGFSTAAVRFGKPGALWVAPIGSAEPADEHAVWGTGWFKLGYTDAGSTFAYDITTANVEVEEELDVIATVTTARAAHVTAALAQITFQNLMIAMNGGILTSSDTGEAWTFEPPELGDEVRVMLGWDAYKGAVTAAVTGPPAVAAGYPQNDLRMVFRKVFQGGSVSMSNRKGNTKSTIPVDFKLEKPDNGGRLLKIMGSASLNPA